MKIDVVGVEAVRSELRSVVEKTIRELADEVFVDARANTPVRSGNARRNWTKQVQKNNFVVENRVPYIERLEAGASKQAPRGIIGPTLDQIKGKV